MISASVSSVMNNVDIDNTNTNDSSNGKTNGDNEGWILNIIISTVA